MGWSCVNSWVECRKVWFTVFVLIYSLACSQMIQMTNMSGWFSSPSFPSNYPGNVQCSWNISIPSGYKIYLTFLEFDVEECGDSCTCDYVEVHLALNFKSQGRNIPAFSATTTFPERWGTAILMAWLPAEQARPWQHRKQSVCRVCSYPYSREWLASWSLPSASLKPVETAREAETESKINACLV